MTIIVGIDLGVSGAVSAVDSHGSAQVEDLPILADDSGKRLDAPAFIRMLRSLIPAADAGRIFMEDVHVMRVAGRAMSHSTETTLVGIRYAVQAAADIARIRVDVVSPQKWKKHYGIKGDKTGAEARKTAAGLYPQQAHKLARVKDHNRAEALLIAHWGKGQL